MEKFQTIELLKIKWSGRQDLNLQPHGPKPRALPSCATSRLQKIIGAPEGIRTPDLLVRSQTLYPAELQARNFYGAFINYIYDYITHYFLCQYFYYKFLISLY